MTVGEIVSLAAFMLGDTEFAQKIEQYLADQYTFTKEEESKAEELLRCYNVAASEIASDYYPARYKEDIAVKDGKLRYGDFTKIPIEIKKVFSNNEPIPFEVYPTYTEVNSDLVTVEYYYLLKDAKSLKDVSDYSETLITKRVLAEGTVTEYLMTKGMFEEGLLWRQRFYRSAQSSVLKRKVGKIKTRGWY